MLDSSIARDEARRIAANIAKLPVFQLPVKSRDPQAGGNEAFSDGAFRNRSG